MTLRALRSAIRAEADPARAAFVAGFFKTGPGQYGEGDNFLGIAVPVLRRIAREHRELSLQDTLTLLRSSWHEERAVALIILVEAHNRGTEKERVAIHRAYLANTAHVNNWDLVDAAAGDLVGSHIPERGMPMLERLAKSPSLWERRIAIVATFWTIRHDNFAPTLAIAERLMNDGHDLLHKAIGWMLREVGKRDPAVLRAFLEIHAATMPRTALRYAIERMAPAERKDFMGRRARSRG